jgi:enoyl-CoA hydratase/carnithine racemase
MTVALRADDDVLWATIERPHARNAIDLDVVTGLERMVERAAAGEVKVLVLRGAGGTFCSGADLAVVRRLVDDPSALRAFMARLGAVLSALEQAPCVTIAAVEGYAVAGGCELLLASDIVVAANDAWIGDRHVEYGLVPAAGGSVRLPRNVAGAVARYLLLTGDVLNGADAAACGLATFAVDNADLDDEVRRIVDLVRRRGRQTLTMMKAMLAPNRAQEEPALAAELDRFVEHVVDGTDAVAGLQAFHERVEPRFDGASLLP